MITAFLWHLENERGNSVRTRNARLTAIHSFFHYAALKAPECSELIARVLAIPEKRFDTTLISYLTQPESRRAIPGRARPLHLDRPTRPRPAALGGADRAAGHRAREPALPRPPARRRRIRALLGQRPKGKVHPTQPPDQTGAARLAARARRRPRQPRYSPAAAAGTSPAERSGASWSNTPPSPASGVPHSPAKNITPHTLRHTAAMRLLHAPTSDRHRDDRAVAWT